VSQVAVVLGEPGSEPGTGAGRQSYPTLLSTCQARSQVRGWVWADQVQTALVAVVHSDYASAFSSAPACAR